MSHRLVCIMGPSGVGKDSVLAALRAQWPDAERAHWVRRSITRPATAGGEAHEALDRPTFDFLRDTGAFALHWEAHGLGYGIRWAELAPLTTGRWVFLNGSRAHWSAVRHRWPQATLVHITAPAEVLAQRLAARGRESAADIAARLARAEAWPLPPDAITVHNTGALQDTATCLQRTLQALDAQASAALPA